MNKKKEEKIPLGLKILGGILVVSFVVMLFFAFIESKNGRESYYSQEVKVVDQKISELLNQINELNKVKSSLQDKIDSQKSNDFSLSDLSGNLFMFTLLFTILYAIRILKVKSDEVKSDKVPRYINIFIIFMILVTGIIYFYQIVSEVIKLF